MPTLHPNTPRRSWLSLVAVGTITILALVALAPPAQASPNTTYGLETFETYTPLTEVPNGDWFTYSTQNVNSPVSVQEAHTGTQSLKLQQAAATGFASYADLTGSFNMCNNDYDHVQLWINVQSLPDTDIIFRGTLNAFSTAATATMPALLEIPADGTWRTGDTVVLDQWVDFELYYSFTGSNGCDGSNNVATCLVSNVLEFNGCSGGIASQSTTSNFDTFQIAFQDSVEPMAGVFFIDDLNFDDQPLPEPGGSIFCSDPSEDNFGYDYVEGVIFADSGTGGIGLDDHYRFQGDSGDSEYLGKAVPPGSKWLSTIFTVEAGEDSSDSLFRVAYTTGATTLTAGAAGDSGADQTAAGDGTDGGNFDNNVQVRFVEEGSNWRITMRQNNGGLGLAQMEGSVATGNPNTATAYNFTIDGRGTGGPIASLRTYPDGELIFQRETSFAAGQTWKDQWFIGKGDSGLFLATTALDNNDGGVIPSTCIYDWMGTAAGAGSIACHGSCGAEPTNEVAGNDDAEEGGGSDGPSGSLDELTGTNLDLFLGSLMMISLSAGIFFIIPHPVGAGVGAFGGFIISYAIGWFDLWLIVLVVVLAIAGVFLFVARKG